VGARANLSLSEVIVSVQSPSGSMPYSNLHVGLPRSSLKSFSRSECLRVERIVRRTEPRISSRIVEVILATHAAFPRSSFDAAFKSWKHAPEWEVELVVTSLCL
jgi:hypothetical protein